MGDIIGDVYEISGEYQPVVKEWRIDLNYSSGKAPASGLEDDENNFMWELPPYTSKFFLALYDDTDEQIYIRLIKASDLSRSIEEIPSLPQYRFKHKALPVLPDVSRVRLGSRETGEVHWEHFFDPHQKPEVSFVSSPSGYVNGPVTLRWEGSDPEGRELTYRLAYSNHEGRQGSWSRSAPKSVSTEVEVDLSRYSGSYGEGSRFRVIAYNGVNFSVAESGLFTVPSKPAIIEVFGDTTPITLAKGRGFHGTTVWARLYGPGREGLSEEDITWVSNIDGFIGRGHTFSPSELSVGEHTISARVETDAGLVTTERVKTITILDESPQISVRVGDGAGDLKCNEIELDVQVEQVDIEYVNYGFNPSRYNPSNLVKDLSVFPVYYQMVDDTTVDVLAKNTLKNSASYRELIEEYDCEALQKAGQP